MTASAYLSAKSDNDPQAVKSCMYTRRDVYDYRRSDEPAVSTASGGSLHSGFGRAVGHGDADYFGVQLLYLSRKDYNFSQRFLEMFVISGSVAVISFLVGLVIKAWLGIDI